MYVIAMTNRELFHATMRGENGGDLLHFEQAFIVPYKKWYVQGMPSHVKNAVWAELTPDENLYDHFNVSGWLMSLFEQFCVPKFDEIQIENDTIKGRRVTTDRNGNTLMWIDDANYFNDDGSVSGSPPHELDFLIKTPREYEKYRHLYVGNHEERIKKEWLAVNSHAYREQTDFISALYVHGPFAFLRELMGTEAAIALPYEEPVFMRRILRDHLDTCKAVSQEMIRAVRPDCSFVWEDCCGSSGPFISPAIFDDMFSWWYREWKDFIVSMGVRWSILDTDGDPSPLVKRWYDAGIDCIHPWEVNAVDMLRFAEDYPDFCIMGGIYKHIFEPGSPTQAGKFRSDNVREAIGGEIERVVCPMRKRGKYIISLDHAAYRAVNYRDYRYYCDLLSNDFGKANVSNRKYD